MVYSAVMIPHIPPVSLMRPHLQRFLPLLCAQVQTPARFMVRAIASGRVVGIWRDSLGVEYVRVYAFTATE